MKLHKVVLGAVAAFALAATATSASAGGRGSVKDYESARDSWTGLYAGINAGWGWSDASWDNISLVGAPIPEKPKGGLVGGQIGYNWQSGNFVLGVESSLSAGWLK